MYTGFLFLSSSLSGGTEAEWLLHQPSDPKVGGSRCCFLRQETSPHIPRCINGYWRQNDGGDPAMD